MNLLTRQISLQKRNQRYVFRYAAGQESEIVGAFASMASNPADDFDWFDACLLSYQIGRRFEIRIDSTHDVSRTDSGQVSRAYSPL